jgi:hypothetical protein
VRHIVHGLKIFFKIMSNTSLKIFLIYSFDATNPFPSQNY